MKKQVLWIAGAFIGSFILLSMTAFTSNEQEKWDVPAKYQKMVNPYADATDDEKIGRILYSKHCKSCHGTKGKGDGTKAETIDTEMGDFTDGSLKDQTDGSLYYKTFIGRDDMPSFKKKIADEEEQWLVINYIKGL
jgi:mono/diheme cytochrome c family protein